MKRKHIQIKKRMLKVQIRALKYKNTTRDLFYTWNFNKIKIFSSLPMRLCICRNCLL